MPRSAIPGILRTCFLEEDFMMLSAAKEKRQHGSMQVPYSYYDCRMPDYFPGVPLHWHGEMELNYIKRGTGYFQYEDRLLTAHAGDIFLIQPNLVHAILLRLMDDQRPGGGLKAEVES